MFSSWDDTIKQAQEEIERKENEIQVCKNELRRISISNEIGIYTDEEAKEEASKVRQEIAVLEMERGDIKILEYDTEKVRDFTSHFLQNITTLWERVDLPKKRLLQSSIFPVGIDCGGDKILRTTNIAGSFQLLKALDSANDQNVSPLSLRWNPKPCLIV